MLASSPSTMFEIRVAVIGYVSVGKTTVINALFGAEYGEVAMKRTTAVVNSFRISSSKDETETAMNVDDNDSTENSIEMIVKNLSSSETLKETTQDNAAFRHNDVVKEKTFDIALEEPLHGMRSDTRLVVVDVPGINEVGTSSKYKDFVKDNWHTFDIVLVVMDARQGVNTDEQQELLQLVKDNLAIYKKMPVIILSNKVDDPDDKEQSAILDEARAAIERLFCVTDRKKALSKLLGLSCDQHIDSSLFPAIIPISAMHAFVYRCGSRLSFTDFCKMDEDFINRIGKDSYGRQWNRFDKREQLEKAFEAVNEKDQQEDGVEASNFGSFTKVLSIAIGGKERQESLLERQVEIAMKRMQETRPGCDLAAELLLARRTLLALGKSTDYLPGVFWECFKHLKKQAFDEFDSTFSIKFFSRPINQLLSYAKALQTIQWRGEMQKVTNAAKELTLQYAIRVIESKSMKDMSNYDQSLVLGSMLLCSSESAFNANFGFLRLHLEIKHIKASQGATSLVKGTCPSCHQSMSGKTGSEFCSKCNIICIDSDVTMCPYCFEHYGYTRQLSIKKDAKGDEKATCTQECGETFRVNRGFVHKLEVADGKLVPVNVEEYKKGVTVIVPDSLEDSEHFGHLIWKSCQVFNEANAQKK